VTPIAAAVSWHERAVEPRWGVPDTDWPTVDLVVVAHESASDLDALVSSVAALEYPADKRTFTLVDNASSDNGVDVAVRAAERYGVPVKVVRLADNRGFGAGVNAGARSGRGQYVFVLNADVTLDSACLSHLVVAAQRWPKAGLVEARQVPHEHPKYYDPVRLETSWVTAAACLVPRDVFTASGGFDEALFMYCEDVDLSWRIRALGWICYYVPYAVVTHAPDNPRPRLGYYAVLHNLFLRWRYGSIGVIAGGYLRLAGLLARARWRQGRHHPWRGVFVRHLGMIPNAVRPRAALRRASVATFTQWEYGSGRPGAGPPLPASQDSPLVSVVIRTRSRPTMLREALASIAWQTYRPVEAVVAEDGSTEGEAVAREFVDRLTLRYLRLPPGSERMATGNAGVAAAQGRYVVLLDDDDVLYADHVETLVAAATHEGTRFACVMNLWARQRIASMEPLRYTIDRRELHWAGPFNRLELMMGNVLNVHCVLFERDAFMDAGGFDEALDGYQEDWDLWLRLLCGAERIAFVPKATAEHRRPMPSSPAARAAMRERQRRLDAAYQVVQAKHRATLSALDRRALAAAIAARPRRRLVEVLRDVNARGWRPSIVRAARRWTGVTSRP
jgi:GT2 family glycosyltransferase